MLKLNFSNHNFGFRALKAGSLSYAFTVIFNAVLLIVKDMNPLTIKAGMKNLTTHHWITHEIFCVILFLILTLIFTKIKLITELSIIKLMKYVIVSTILSSALIILFYLIHG